FAERRPLELHIFSFLLFRGLNVLFCGISPRIPDCCMLSTILLVFVSPNTAAVARWLSQPFFFCPRSSHGRSWAGVEHVVAISSKVTYASLKGVHARRVIDPQRVQRQRRHGDEHLLAI